MGTSLCRVHYLHLPMYTLVELPSQFCPQTHVSHELMSFVAQLATGLVFMYSSGYLSLVRATPITSIRPATNDVFCMCWHVLWPNPVCLTPHLAVVHTHELRLSSASPDLRLSPHTYSRVVSSRIVPTVSLPNPLLDPGS